MLFTSYRWQLFIYMVLLYFLFLSYFISFLFQSYFILLYSFLFYFIL